MTSGRIVALAVLAIVVASIIRVLRGRRVPAFDATTGEPVVWPELGPVTVPAPEPRKGSPTPAPPADLAPDPQAAPPVTADVDGTGWVEPNADGSCPDGFPVKAKMSSGIFHVPEGAFYDRTTPDRCYPDAPAAEADHLRPAKR